MDYVSVRKRHMGLPARYSEKDFDSSCKHLGDQRQIPKITGMNPSAARDCSTYQFRRVTFRLYAKLSELEFQQ